MTADRCSQCGDWLRDCQCDPDGLCDHCGDPVTVAGDVTCGDCQRYLMRGDA